MGLEDAMRENAGGVGPGAAVLDQQMQEVIRLEASQRESWSEKVAAAKNKINEFRLSFQKLFEQLEDNSRTSYRLPDGKYFIMHKHYGIIRMVIHPDENADITDYSGSAQPRNFDTSIKWQEVELKPSEENQSLTVEKIKFWEISKVDKKPIIKLYQGLYTIFIDFRKLDALALSDEEILETARDLGQLLAPPFLPQKT